MTDAELDAWLASQTLSQIADRREAAARRLGVQLPAGTLYGPEEVAEVVRAYRELPSMKHVAQSLSMSAFTVHRILHDAGVPIRPRGRPRLDRPEIRA